VETFLSLEAADGYVIRQKLLEALGTETTNSVRNKIGDAVAEIAREYSDNSMFIERRAYKAKTETDKRQNSNGLRFWAFSLHSAYRRKLDNEKLHTEYFQQLLVLLKSNTKTQFLRPLQLGSRTAMRGYATITFFFANFSC